ncbi:MAG: hydantoinase/oxoprolinase family protein, partial [Pseudomonadota bacterium]
MKAWEFWIDKGGTFTDIIAVSPERKILTYKLLSECPRQYKDAIRFGINQILNQSKAKIEKINQLKFATTIATNALLQHKGEPTLLVITKGFADALKIGYQNRPNLFVRNIVLPEPIYARVIEVDERINCRGEILNNIDRIKLKQKLKTAYNQGFRAISIVLLHGYHFTQHEVMIARIAKSVGFKQISCSHEVNPEIKLISRGTTTVIDAYLSPIIRNYITKVAKTFAKTKLYLMQSNGGIVKASQFKGKDSTLSGPAAGVVGAIKVAAMNKIKKLITFDMGGTSTDVAHYSGEIERLNETELAGFLLRGQMLHIHTIAAGGGSVIAFDQNRFQVGPESAGAVPGPACYRNGGPLTLTDCNVLLGKIQPDYFPKTFGNKHNLAIDKMILHKKFQQLTKKINHKLRKKYTPFEVAAGFIQVAVSNMANAIKKISVQRGFNLIDHTLFCFGGAGGQHACAIANELGMKKILIHPYQGLLSALGLGLADIRTIKEKPIDKPLTQKNLLSLTKEVKQLQQNILKKISKQIKQNNTIFFENRVKLRYIGSDTLITILLQPKNTLMKRFERQHKKQFGYKRTKQKIIIESILVELIETNQLELALSYNLHEENKQLNAKAIEFYSQHSFKKAVLYLRSNLKQRQKIIGPAMIVDDYSTIIVELGWQAKL